MLGLQMLILGLDLHALPAQHGILIVHLGYKKDGTLPSLFGSVLSLNGCVPVDLDGVYGKDDMSAKNRGRSSEEINDSMTTDRKLGAGSCVIPSGRWIEVFCFRAVVVCPPP